MIRHEMVRTKNPEIVCGIKQNSPAWYNEGEFSNGATIKSIVVRIFLSESLNFVTKIIDEK